MLEGKWKVALYVDERANQDQQNALIQIFSGQAGGHFGRPCSADREVLELRQARSNIIQENDAACVSANRRRGD